MSKNEFTKKIIATARRHGWSVAEVNDGKGFRLWFLLHPGRRQTRFVAVRTNTSKVSAEQQEWLDALKLACFWAETWRPIDWDTWLCEYLKG